MKVFVINTGSSSLKFGLFLVPGERDDANVGELARGQISHIGPDAVLEVSAPGSKGVRRPAATENHKDAVGQALSALREILPGSSLEVQAVGHRVVHGGDRFVQPTLIDDSALSVLESLNELAPLHNPSAVEGIRAVREVLGPDIPSVGVFDTAFHATMPEQAYTYALPYETARKHGVRRYGFHGTAHEYMLQRYVALSGVAAEQATIITLQLGNGCSACAISRGRSVDTSMGFTPLEGLVMGTRSGDLDPGVVTYLAHKEGFSAEEVVRILNERSGLLGISGQTGDMRELLAAEGSDERARLAVGVFCYRVSKYIGAYMAALGGAKAVVFGGGIGENAPPIRARICARMKWCGLNLDSRKNEQSRGVEGLISADTSPVGAYVVTVDEDSLIATHTAHCIRQSAK